MPTLTASEAAAALGVSLRTIQRAIRSGALAAEKEPGAYRSVPAWRIAREALDAWWSGPEPWVPLAVAAHRLGIHYETARRWARDGPLTAVKLGRDWRVPSRVLDAMLKKK